MAREAFAAPSKSNVAGVALYLAGSIGCFLHLSERGCQRRAHVVAFNIGVGVRVASEAIAAKAIPWRAETAPSAALNVIVRFWNQRLEAPVVISATVVLADIFLYILCNDD